MRILCVFFLSQNKNNYQSYISIDEKHIWGYVGSDAASYTKSEVDNVVGNINAVLSTLTTVSEVE
mgnify:CR=1 FL=1